MKEGTETLRRNMDANNAENRKRFDKIESKLERLEKTGDNLDNQKRKCDEMKQATSDVTVQPPGIGCDDFFRLIWPTDKSSLVTKTKRTVQFLQH